MKIRIEDISAEARDVAFSEPPNELNRLLGQGPIRDYLVEGPVAVSLSHYRAGMELFFEGSLRLETAAACARCAEQFNGASARSFRFVLAPRAAGDTAQPDLRTEDLEFSFYDGDEIDLAPLIREQALLALPTRPLCDESCRGLCPVCGANRNQRDCGCSVEVPDARLAALRPLRVQRS